MTCGRGFRSKIAGNGVFASFFPSSRDAASAGAQVLDRLVAAEEVEEDAQSLAALALEVGVALEDEAGVVMGHRDQLLVGRKIGEAQARQPALPGSRYLAGAAQ